MDAPRLTPFCVLHVELGTLREMGPGRAGQRRIIPILGGTVSGRLTGTILNLGADWQTIFTDGAADIDTRYAMETADGALIEIVNKGVRHGPPDIMARLAKGEPVDPGSYYFRTTARLESGDPRYAWVNHLILVGSGARGASGVEMHLFAVD
jgi:hypothetical protein